jgi:hypothetical protein
VSPVNIGEMRVYPSVRPRLSAGVHDVELRQTIDQGGMVPSVTRHVDVTAPRFKLAPNEILSVFPPPNAVGAFETRLPQIALKRRTLPWERPSNDAPIATRPPWLALVVLADGEANFRSNVAIADAVPADVRARQGMTETGTCDVLEVSRTVVDKVFPREDELPLLSHVREVNLLDTEFATGDDDGFVAVVISNRLPQPGIRYGCYLISLEGRLAELPDPQPPVDDLGSPFVFPDKVAQFQEASFAHNRALGGMELGATREPRLPGAPVSAPAQASAWSKSRFATRATGAAELTVSGAGAAADPPVKQASFAGSFLFDAIDFSVIDVAGVALLRFPVLAHWSFTCDQGGDYQALMQALDVGLLGTVPPPAGERGADTPPAPQVTDTGHTVIEHLTRRGEPATAWYRGPLTPREVHRRAAGAPYHAADQARRIAEDGREDLSEAAAFEIGRLLAMAEPRFVAELQAWRRSGFSVRRAAALLDRLPGLHALGIDPARLARTLNLAVLDRVAGARAIGPTRPVDDVGPLLRDDDADAIAAGLDLDVRLVAEVLSDELTRSAIPPGAFEPQLSTGLEGVLGDAAALDGLLRTVDRTVERISKEGER